MKNVFTEQVSSELIARINQLTPDSHRQWGKMTPAQMLAHCNVAYEMTYEDKHPAPGPFMKLILKWLVKDKVVSDKPHKPNVRTAPAFIIADDKDFDAEKARLIGYIERTRSLGEDHFHMKEQRSFGKLTKTEWSNMFYKHLDHHLKQFGV